MAVWRRHRWTALRSLLLVALLHSLDCLAFLAASSPVWLIAAFLLGVVLVHSEPNVPLAAASEYEDRYLYKKIRHRTRGRSSSEDSSDDDDDGSSVTSMEEEHLAGEKEEEEEVVKAAVAWTADDEHSIQSIGSLELERDARLEKLMSRRSIHRNLIDLDVHINAVLTKNPFDLHHHRYDDPGSAPSSLLGQHTNPFDFDIHQRDPEMLRRHESLTAGAAPLARPSRFRPYFVADVPEGGGDAGSDNTNSSSSPSSSAASDHQAQQQAAVKVEEAPAAPAAAAAATPPLKWDGNGNGMVMAVDVELISDSSDDDMSLPGDDAAGSLLNNPDEDEDDSFEVESITQQVAAGERQQSRATAMEMEEDASINSCSKEWVAPTTLASVEENEKRERELSEIREHHILGPVPVIDDSSTSAAAGVGAAGVVVEAAAPPPPAAAALAPAPPPAATAAVAAPAPAPAASAPSPSPSPSPAASAPAPPATSEKPSSKSKVASKKAVFGFFRK